MYTIMCIVAFGVSVVLIAGTKMAEVSRAIWEVAKKWILRKKS